MTRITVEINRFGSDGKFTSEINDYLYDNPELSKLAYNEISDALATLAKHRVVAFYRVIREELPDERLYNFSH